MADCSTNEENAILINTNAFPSVINGQINIVKFLKASIDLVAIVERLGTVFAPVKYDMQGNIHKIQKHYKYNENSCILELMLEEAATGKTTAAEAVLWLNRALLFFELAFQEVLNHIRSGNYEVNMKKIFAVAYEGSVKQYHNWVTQQLFALICKMSPTLHQLMKSFEVDLNVNHLKTKLESFIIPLHLVRCKLDDFFRENDIVKVASQRQRSLHEYDGTGT